MNEKIELILKKLKEDEFYEVLLEGSDLIDIEVDDKMPVNNCYELKIINKCFREMYKEDVLVNYFIDQGGHDILYEGFSYSKMFDTKTKDRYVLSQNRSNSINKLKKIIYNKK